MRWTCYFASALILLFGVANTVLADNDNGTPPSTLGMSFEQVKQAAAQGDPDAEYALGYMYYYGKDGAVRDLISAKMWIEKAAAQGQPQAIKAAQLLGLADHPRQGGSTTKPPFDRLKHAARTEPKKPVYSSAKVMNSAMNEQRLLKAPSHYYTVQLLGAFNKKDITDFVKQHHLQARTAVYKTYFHEKPWYVLVYGIYATDAEAQAAIHKLPASIRKLTPWVKSLASVHEGIKKEQPRLAVTTRKHHTKVAKNRSSSSDVASSNQTSVANNDTTSGSNSGSSNDQTASNDQAASNDQSASANNNNVSNAAQNSVSPDQNSQGNQSSSQMQAANANNSAQNGNMNNQQAQPTQANNADNAGPDQMQQNSMASEDTY